MKRVSYLETVPGRYVVATGTPDDGRSTFRECWGAGAKYSARAVFASDSLAEAVASADGYGRWAVVYDRSTGRKVGAKRLAEATA